MHNYLYRINQQFIKLLPLKLQIKLFSALRNSFIKNMYNQTNITPFIPHSKWSTELWGIKFISPLINAAGMFKNGEAYDFVNIIGAGGYLAGSSTVNPQIGNTKLGIRCPAINLTTSHSTLNYLGLPNQGDQILTKKIISTNKRCPIGWSLATASDQPLALKQLINSLFKYQENTLIDFIEINESCQNINHDLSKIEHHLIYIAQKFLTQRRRKLPVIIKLHDNISFIQLKKILTTLIVNNYDGVNLINSSIRYDYYRPLIAPADQAMFDYFSHKIGGGIGGKVLKNTSLQFATTAMEIVAQLNPNHEFNVIRTGGIDCLADILVSQQIGIKLNQWYSGFFTRYLIDHTAIYRNFFKD